MGNKYILSKQNVKKIISILLLFCITLYFNSVNFANVYTSGSEQKIEETFDATVHELKNGNYECTKNVLYISSIEKGNKVIKLIPMASDVFDWIGLGKDILGDTLGIKKFMQELTTKIFEIYDFKVINIQRKSAENYSLTLEINMPDTNYYEKLDETGLMYDKSNVGAISSAIKITEIFNSGSMSPSALGIFPDAPKYDYLFRENNSLDYNRKKVVRTINIIKDDDNYKFDISNLVGFDLALARDSGFSDDRVYVYKGSDVDDKNLYNYLFVPMWKIVRSEYKFK